MNLFSKFNSNILKNPCFNNRPDFVNGLSSALGISGKFKFELMLEFSKKEILENFGYKFELLQGVHESDISDSEFSELERNLILFEILGFFLLKKTLPDILSFDFSELSSLEMFQKEEFVNENDLKEFFLLPSLLLDKALRDYSGEFVPNVSTSNLICRCFGVTEESINAHIKNLKDEKFKSYEDVLKNLTGISLAGGGCTSCSEDLQEQIKQTILLDKVPRVVGERNFIEILNDLQMILVAEVPSFEVVEYFDLESLRITHKEQNFGSHQAGIIEKRFLNELGINVKFLF